MVHLFSIAAVLLLVCPSASAFMSTAGPGGMGKESVRAAAVEGLGDLAEHYEAFLIGRQQGLKG